MSQAVKLAETVLIWIVGSIFGSMLSLIFLQVLNRFVLDWPLFWTEEAVRILLVWTVLLALPLVTLRREEISVELGSMDLFLRRPLIDVISVVFCSVLAWYGYQFFLRNLPAISPTLGLSRGWFVAPIPVGAVLTILATAARYLPAFKLQTSRT